MRILKNKVSITLLLIIASVTNVLAQDPGDLGGDPGAAPIGDYVPMMLIAAIGLGYFVIRKQQLKKV